MASMQEIYKVYTYNPMIFVWPVFIFLVTSLLAFLSLLFVYINISTFLSFFEFNNYLLLFIFSIFFIYFFSGFFGGMLKGLKVGYETKRRISFEDYVYYANEKNLYFFIIFLIKIAINFSLIFLVYNIFANQTFPIQLIGLLFFSFFFFVLNYFLHFLTIGTLIYEGLGFIKTLRMSFLTSLKNFFYLIVPYTIHIIVLASFLLPFFNLFSIFMFYPIVETFAIERMRKVASS